MSELVFAWYGRPGYLRLTQSHQAYYPRIMIQRIESQGMFFKDCTLPGETRADDLFPAHPNAIPLARDRWLVLYSTRGFEGIDDERSIIYQIREGSLTGRVLRENWMARCVNDWDPDGDGSNLRKEHGHPGAFGVPEGALIGGKVPAHAGLFVAKWRVVGKNYSEGTPINANSRKGQAVEWAQFRLNATRDDIEFVMPPQTLHQKGFSAGPFCSLPEVAWMNQTFVQAVPFNAEADEWAEVNHFDGGCIAPLKYRYEPASGLYEWVETGAPIRRPGGRLHEASLLKTARGWVIAARSDPGPIQWFLMDDPFGKTPTSVPGDFNPQSPISVYAAPDGSVLLLTGNAALSPHHNARDPLYAFEVDVDGGFRSSSPRVIMDSVAAGIPIRPESVSRVDMGKLVTHAGGSVQHVLHRIRTKSINYPANTKAVTTPEEKLHCGIYRAEIHYADDLPAAWDYAG